MWVSKFSQPNLEASEAHVDVYSQCVRDTNVYCLKSTGNWQKTEYSQVNVMHLQNKIIEK